MSKMKLTQWLLPVLLAGALAPAAQKKDTLSIELQAAIQKESVQGDLKGAIAMYEKILARAGSERGVASQALLRIGQCYEKLGSAEARKAYERLVRDFGDQKDAGEARARLAALGGGPAPALDRVLYESSFIGIPRTSRDGRFLAFQCYEAICLIDSTTASVTTAVPAPPSRPARHWRPLASPDGQWIAFTHFANERVENKGDLRLARTGESASKLLIEGSTADQDYFSAVDWTADGKSILVAKTNRQGAMLLLVPAAGGPALPLETPGFDWTTGRDESRFSPDGKWIAYPASKKEKQGGGYVPTDVYIMPAAGGEAWPVFTGAAHERVIGWLASGDLIASSNRTGSHRPYRIHIVDGKPQGDPQLIEEDLGDATVAGVNMNSGALFLLAEERATGLSAFRPGEETLRKLSLDFEGGRPAFSPDGSKLAYTVGNFNSPNSVVIRDMAKGEERRLPSTTPYIMNLAWYPDNRNILAICNTGNWGSRPTFRVDTVTGEVKPAAHIVGMNAIWTPAILSDGKTLLVTTREPGAEMGSTGIIQAMDLETGAMRPLFRSRGKDCLLGSFSVSPDRKRIVYMDSRIGAEESSLWISSIDNPQPRLLFESKAPGGQPSVPYFTPDQRSVVFWRNAPGGRPRELWVIPVEGGEAKLLRKIEWTPDGPAFNPATGEIVIGTGKYSAQLRVKSVKALVPAAALRH